jgi:hypothetical protein
MGKAELLAVPTSLFNRSVGQPFSKFDQSIDVCLWKVR